MLRGQLRQILNHNIDNVYLKEDNKKPEGLLETVGSLFSSSGADGRARADQYKKSVIGHLVYNEDDLLLRVYGDILDPESAMGSSRKLRFRLLQGLGQFLGVTEAEVTSKRQALTMATYKGLSTTYAPVYPPLHFDMEAMKALVSERIAPIQEMQRKSNIALTMSGEDEGL